MPNLHLCDLDLNKNALLNPVIHPVGTAPSSPVEGQIYYDNTGGDKQIYVYNGTGWVSMGGDVTSVIAGDGLTGGGTSGAVTLNVIGGTGITANANDIALTNGLIADGSNITSVGTIGTGVWQGTVVASAYLDADTAHLSGNQTFTGTKTLNSFKGTAGATVTNILDEDAMGSNSATALATQQSIKAYADTKSVIAGSTSLVTLGTVTTGVWNGTAIASAYLDADTAHLTTTQTFTGAKTFTGTVALTGTGRITGIDTVSAATDAASKTYVDAHVWDGNDITTGTVVSARLDADTAHLTTAQTFTGSKTMGTNVKLNFRDANAYINSPTANDIEVVATTITLDAGSDIQLEGATTVTGNLSVSGNLNIDGTTTTIDSTTVAIADSMLKLAKDQANTADALDFGFYGQYGVGGTHKYAGVFRDGSVTGDPFTFFDGLQAEPGTTVNTAGTGYDLADISAGAITSADGFTGDLTGDVTGNADTATTLETARTIGGVSFNGSANINLPGVNSAGNQNTTGSAATLTTARTIGGVSFNGSANINLPGVNTAGNQNTSGSAATLTTARTIGGVSFNGSANINLPGVNTAGNQNTTGNAATATNLVASTSSVVGLGSINMGHASDTTIARSAAGRVTIEGQQVATSKSFALAHATSGVAGNNSGTNDTVFTITHGMGDQLEYMVQVIAASGGATVFPCVTRTDATVVITFNVATAQSAYTALLVKI